MERGRKLRRFFFDGGERVRQSGQHPFVDDFLIGKFEAGLLEYDQVSREIAAVNHRHVMRPQGLQAARVVPVEEMAAKLLQLFHAREGEFDSFEQLNQPQVTKVVGGER